MSVTTTAPLVAVPTLGATTLLTDPSQIIAYQLRQFATTPKSLSTLYYDQVISLSDIISRSANDAQAVATPTQVALTTVFNRIFGPGSATVSATIEQRTDTSYSLIIAVQISYNNQIYGISNTVQVNNGLLILENDSVPPVSMGPSTT